jgi:hypothetical protein
MSSVYRSEEWGVKYFYFKPTRSLNVTPETLLCVGLIECIAPRIGNLARPQSKYILGTLDHA